MTTLTKEEVFATLDESWAAGDLNIWSTTEEVQNISDWHDEQVTEEVLREWSEDISDQKCLYGERHRRVDCTEDCSNR
jgi:hypothetical protein